MGVKFLNLKELRCFPVQFNFKDINLWKHTWPTFVESYEKLFKNKIMKNLWSFPLWVENR
jgi:hypothetical protein